MNRIMVLLKASGLAVAVLTLSLAGQSVLAPDARAGLNFCNESSYDVEVAIGYKDAEGGWISEGWWPLESNGGCATVVEGDLSNRYYYFHAEHMDVSGSWTGSYSFCTSSDAFTAIGDHDCEARGYDREGFEELDTGDAAEYTYTLYD